MHALIYGLVGALLGLVAARVRSRLLRRVLLVGLSLGGLAAIVAANALIAEQVLPGLEANLSLGGGVFLLALWYCANLGRRARA